MPKNLTDVSTFTDPIVVPVGTDPRTAASVELPVQGLANRTKRIADKSTLQRAYDRSVIEAETPHIDVGTGSLVLGGATKPTTLTVEDGKLTVVENLTFDATDFNLVNGGSGQRALIHSGGVGGTIRLESGLWTLTPPFDVSGSGASGADITNGDASFIRVGDIVSFGMNFALDGTAYSAGAYAFEFNPPVSSNFSSSYDVQGVAKVTVNTAEAPLAAVSAETSNNVVRVAFTLASTFAFLLVRVSGTYRVRV